VILLFIVYLRLQHDLYEPEIMSSGKHLLKKSIKRELGE